MGTDQQSEANADRYPRFSSKKKLFLLSLIITDYPNYLNREIETLHTDSMHTDAFPSTNDHLINTTPSPCKIQKMVPIDNLCYTVIHNREFKYYWGCGWSWDYPEYSLQTLDTIIWLIIWSPVDWIQVKVSGQLIPAPRHSRIRVWDIIWSVLWLCDMSTLSMGYNEIHLPCIIMQYPVINVICDVLYLFYYYCIVPYLWTIVWNKKRLTTITMFTKWPYICLNG